MSFNDRFTNIDVTPFLKEIHQFHRKEFPQVVRTALTSQATRTYTYAQRNIESKFTLRNKYTVGSVRYLKPRGNAPSKMQSEVGSYQDYMSLQEHGGKAKNKALVTSEARIQKDSKRVTRRKIRLSQVGDLPEFKGENLVGELASFSRKGDKTKFAIIEGNGLTRGIYSVRRTSRGKRKPRHKKERIPFKVRMMYSLKKDSYEIDESPWLMPSAQKTMSSANLFKIYDEAMKKNVKNYSNGNIR